MGYRSKIVDLEADNFAAEVNAEEAISSEIAEWRQRVEAWIASGPTDQELTVALDNMKYCPPIISQAENDWAYARFLTALTDWRRPHRR